MGKVSAQGVRPRRTARMKTNIQKDRVSAQGVRPCRTAVREFMDKMKEGECSGRSPLPYS